MAFLQTFYTEVCTRQIKRRDHSGQGRSDNTGSAFGASLHRFTSENGALMKGKRIIQINDTLSEIGRNYHPDAALVGDAALTADNIVKWLDEADIPSSGFTNELNSKTLTAHPPATLETTKDGTIGFVYALDKLDTALPENRILVTDGGRFMTEVWCRVKAPDAKSFICLLYTSPSPRDS